MVDKYDLSLNIYDLSRWKPLPAGEFLQHLPDLFKLSSATEEGKAALAGKTELEFLDEDGTRARVVFYTSVVKHDKDNSHETTQPYLMVLYDIKGSWSNGLCFIRTDVEPIAPDL